MNVFYGRYSSPVGIAFVSMYYFTILGGISCFSGFFFFFSACNKAYTPALNAASSIISFVSHDFTIGVMVGVQKGHRSFYFLAPGKSLHMYHYIFETLGFYWHSEHLARDRDTLYWRGK